MNRKRAAIIAGAAVRLDEQFAVVGTEAEGAVDGS